MIKRLPIIFLLLIFLGCSTSKKVSRVIDSEIQSEMDRLINDDMPGLLVSVYSKDHGIDWSSTSGVKDKEKKEPLRPAHTFRMASVTKTFVAATILRLWEQGKLDLDHAINKYISEEHVEILKEGGHNPSIITITQLLTHSAGLADHTHTSKYSPEILKSNYVWTRREQLQTLAAFTKPIGKPGEKYTYSDTGYILLGEVIEFVTQKYLGDAIIEELALRKKGLKSIQMEDRSGDFSKNRIHQYWEGIDTYSFNPTFDLYGGGGLLATTHDLSLFYHSLFENQVFQKPSTLEKMLTSVKYTKQQSLDYRMGLWTTEISGMEAYTHAGFWGTQVIYIPEIKTSICVNYSQIWTNRRNAPILETIVGRLKERLKGK